MIDDVMTKDPKNSATTNKAGMSPMSDGGGVTLTLTNRQIVQVVRKATRTARAARVLPRVADLDEMRRMVLPLLDDKRCSGSLLRALLVLAAFPTDRSERAITDVARELDLSPGSTHRYIVTWMGLSLLQQDPHSRRYRRTSSHAPAAST